MTNLNAKLMNDKLKYGWTAADFAEYLSTTEGSFLKAVKETFSKNAANSMLSKLKRNEKRRNQRSSEKVSSKESTLNVCSDTNPISIIEVAEQETLNTCLQSDIVDELMLELKELSKKLCEKEATHKMLISDRKKLYDSLRGHKEKLLKLSEEIQNCQVEILEIADNISFLTNEIKTSNSEIKASRNEMSEVKAKIEEFSKFNIYIYENGDIDIEGKTNFEIPESWTSLVQELTTNPELECLTIKQIKQLAKVLVLTKALKLKGKTFEFTFESEIVQKYFEQLQTP